MFKISPTDFEKAMRIAKFERHFRAIDLNLDNESINSDLVKEYDSNHDDS